MVGSDEGFNIKRIRLSKGKETDIHTETDRLGEGRRDREIRLLD